MKKNLKAAPSCCQIIAVCLCVLQVITVATTQISLEPHENVEIIPETTVIREDRALKESSESDAPCPTCKIISEIPMELAERINEIDDVDVFIHDFVDETNSLSNISSTAGHPSNSRKRRAARDQPRQATCTPLDTIVSVVPPDERDPTIVYFPSCVLLKQCGGCCAHSGTSCTPVDEVEKQVTIKKTKFTGGNKLTSLGDVTVTVKEHKKCRCQCKKTARDCNNLQRFIANQCRCECTNISEADDCGKDPTKLFDTKTCGCVCRDEKECPTGFQFVQSSCSCEPYTDEDDEETHEFQLLGEHSETIEATDDTKYDTDTTAD